MSIRDILNELNKSKNKFINEIGWDNLPKGWDEESVKKFAKSLTGNDEDDLDGFFEKCYDRIKDEEGFDEDSAKKFCASLKDHIAGSTDWRGKDKEEEDK